MKLFYSTDEVADYFGVASSKVRYYVKEFKLKIQTRGKNKAYTKKDIEKLGKIISMLAEDNFKIQGAKEQLKNKNKKNTSKDELIAKLQGIRSILVKLKG